MGASGTSERVWRSWSGLTTAHPASVLVPASVEEVVDAVVVARRQGLRVKMVGAGHSFTDVAATDGLLLRPDRLTGVTALDRQAGTVTVLAGTRLHDLNATLHRLGLSLHNMGDVDRQTVAGAISTGTHGTGGRRASLSAQVAAVQLVAGDGTLRDASPERDRDLFEAARLGLGAVGVLTAVTFRVEPQFVLEAVEEPATWDAVVTGFDDLIAANEHFEAYWFPHTSRMLTKRNNRTREAARPLARWRAYLDDELLANSVFGLLNRVGDLAPATVPPLNKVAARGLSARTYRDAPYRVFTSPRRVRFREMEYAVPRQAGMAALREARALIERRGWRIGFPVEIRWAPADDVWLSTASGRETVYLAFHVNARTDHTAYFTEVERLLRTHGGRPHWGKLHTLTAADLVGDYPRLDAFRAVRDRVDPDRLFANTYLERMLG
jgi:L-gulonolactone oxidase